MQRTKNYTRSRSVGGYDIYVSLLSPENQPSPASRKRDCEDCSLESQLRKLHSDAFGFLSMHEVWLRAIYIAKEDDRN